MTTRFLLGRRGHQLYPNRGAALTAGKQQQQQQQPKPSGGTSTVVGRHGIPAPKRNPWSRLFTRSPAYIGGFALNPPTSRKCSRHASGTSSTNSSSSSSSSNICKKWWIPPILVAVLVVLLTGCCLLVYVFLARLDNIHLKTQQHQNISSSIKSTTFRPSNTFVKVSPSFSKAVMAKHTQTITTSSNRPPLHLHEQMEGSTAFMETASTRSDYSNALATTRTVTNRHNDKPDHELATAFLEDQGRQVVAPAIKATITAMDQQQVQDISHGATSAGDATVGESAVDIPHQRDMEQQQQQEQGEKESAITKLQALSPSSDMLEKRRNLRRV